MCHTPANSSLYPPLHPLPPPPERARMAHRLVLDRVERARGVREQSADFEQRRRAHRQLQLQRVQLEPEPRPPTRPQRGLLPQRAVAGARHVAQHAVVLTNEAPRAAPITFCQHRRAGPTQL
eukprot:4650197-Pleurochrysis_carterae.AAC.2